MTKSTLLGLIIATSVLGVVKPVSGDDWPGWLGAQRDSVVRETGYVDEIPKEGLKTQWRVPIGGGYSGPAVAAGRVYVTDYQATSGKNTNNPGGRDQREGTERIVCLDANSGKEIWTHAYPRSYNISYSNGPRATPTVDGDRVYALGAEGDLICLSVSDGKVVWSKSLPTVYKAETPIWGHAAAPLVHGDLLYCLAGGSGSVVVALNKLTGEEKWRALTASEIGYCAPSIITVAGQKQLLIWTADELAGLDPLTGKVWWSAPLKPSYAMSIAVPRVVGNRLFASGIGEVGAMFELGADGRSIKELWRGKPKTALYSANAPALFEGDTLYGADCGSGQFIAAKASDGTRLWETFEPTSGGTRRASHGTAFIVRQGEHYWLLSERGDLILADLSPTGYKELGRAHVIEPTSDAFGRPVVWTHPAFSNRHAFIRNDQEIISVSLAK
ncbi:MAG: PQQ-like beta-propeller repeat protein [Pirellulaceae bacterium]|nr:PQQ-like beta-propeller repeat protein [Pirellulaceae bacterium]